MFSTGSDAVNVADPTCVFRGGAICIWHVKPHDRAQQRMRAVLRPVAGSTNNIVIVVRLRSRGAPEAQHQMQSTLLLNVVTRQRAAIFQLFACEDQALLVPRGSVRALNHEGTRCPGKSRQPCMSITCVCSLGHCCSITDMRHWCGQVVTMCHPLDMPRRKGAYILRMPLEREKS